MKTLACLVFIELLVRPFLVIAAENALKIFEYYGRDGITNEWYLPVERTLNCPRWDPFKAEPPLSVTNAVAIASNWVARQPRIWGPPSRVDTITLNSLHSNRAPFAGVFYYRIIFDTGTFDHRACIVLMDGSVLEPRTSKASVSRESEGRPADGATERQETSPAEPHGAIPQARLR